MSDFPRNGPYRPPQTAPHLPALPSPSITPVACYRCTRTVRSTISVSTPGHSHDGRPSTTNDCHGPAMDRQAAFVWGPFPAPNRHHHEPEKRPRQPTPLWQGPSTTVCSFYARGGTAGPMAAGFYRLSDAGRFRIGPPPWYDFRPSDHGGLAAPASIRQWRFMADAETRQHAPRKQRTHETWQHPGTMAPAQTPTGPPAGKHQGVSPLGC